MNWQDFPHLDQLTFWAVVAAGWLGGIALIASLTVRTLLREWWDFRVWYRKEKVRVDHELRVKT